MMHKAFRALVIVPCAALLAGAFALQAGTVESEKFEIPFAFHVQKHTMPAGEYRVEQTNGSGFAILVNTKTHETADFLRPDTTHQPGKVRLVFENGADGAHLKSIL